MLEVHVISRETIVPSSPALRSPSTFRLSLLDHMVPSTYVSILFFYVAGLDPSKSSGHVSNKLKASLSESLTYIYPLAGKLGEDGLTLDCNDQGIDFFEAHVDGQLSEFLLREPAAHECNRLLPPEYHFTRASSDMLLAVQLNVFDCGGVTPRPVELPSACLRRFSRRPILRDSINKIDSDYISQLQGPDGCSVNEPLEEILQKSGGRSVEICFFSSWCRFGLYDADFGWGKPTWISLAQASFKNLILPMETRSGDGIEAWVSMDAEEMAAFEQDEDLLSFVSPPKLS